MKLYYVHKNFFEYSVNNDQWNWIKAAHNPVTNNNLPTILKFRKTFRKV